MAGWGPTAPMMTMMPACHRKSPWTRPWGWIVDERLQMPPPPEGCVYGPWWDEGVKGQGCWCYSDGELTYAWLPTFSTWVVTEEVALRKLLRLAKELEQKEARIKELEKELEWRVRADEQ